MAESQVRQNRILERMLEKLHATMAGGPLLSCRPYSSRQRIDLTQLAELEGPRPEQIVPALLGEDASVRLLLPRNRAGEVQGSGNGDGASTKTKDENQALLGRLRTIAEDAKTYLQDTGVHALYVGYPVLQLPADARAGRGVAGKRVLAPIAFIPVQLTVKTTRPASIVLERISDGAAAEVESLQPLN